MNDETPSYLLRYKKTPEEILNGRVLPPSYAEKNKLYRPKAGRPPLYPSSEMLQYAVDRYFTPFENPDPEAPIRYPTIPGLALALGFSTKQMLKRYGEKGPDYEFVVDQAFTRVEEFKNDLLLKGGSTTQAAIADLQVHHGWANKTEQTTTVIPGGSLAELVKSLQGRVLRPTMPIRHDEEIEDAVEIPEVEWEEEDGVTTHNSHVEDAELIDDMDDLI